MPNENGGVNPLVYKTFGSEDMKLDIRNLTRHGDIVAGSVLHFDPRPDLERPPEAQIQALKDFCKRLGITLVVSQTA